MIKPKKVGIYGGTFDPIHLGHLNTAIEIMEYHQLDEVWFCPARINPHKSKVISAPVEHRLKMLEIALTDLPRFGIISNELQRQGPSYTIDTLRELTAEEKNKTIPSQFFWMMGEDSVLDFFNWKEPNEIIKLAPPLIAKRFLAPPLELQGDSVICEALRQGETPTRVMEISASDIRDRIRSSRYIGHLVPGKVVDYIYQNRLYY